MKLLSIEECVKVTMSSNAISFGKNADTGETTIKLAKDRTPAMFLVEAAEATDYGSYTKEATPRTFTVEQLIKQLDKRANDTELNVDGSAKTSPEARMLAARMLKSYSDAVVKALH